MFKWVRRIWPSRAVTVVCNVSVGSDDSGCDQDTITFLQRRNKELLDHNNKQLEENREQRRLLKELAEVAELNHDLLIQNSINTGYCGCDLEKRTVIAVSKVKKNGR